MLIFLSVLLKLMCSVTVMTVRIMKNVYILEAQLNNVRDEFKKKMNEINRSLTAYLTIIE